MEPQLLIDNNRYLARAISLVENNHPDGLALLKKLPFNTKTPVLGITGPPGAGKSSIVNALINEALKQDMKVGVLAVDPTSPFNFGSLLGDRVRMADHFNNDRVYIRSLATRGSLGGLSAKIYEITDIMRHAGFDIIIIETVGVGQSEVEIAGLADTTAVVLVPEAGDEVQTIKSGIMEIADIFIVNKSDRDGADIFVKNLKALVHQRPADEGEIPVIKTVATTGEGISTFLKAVEAHNILQKDNDRHLHLLFDKAWHLIQNEKMKSVDRALLLENLKTAANKTGFNLYQYIQVYTNG